MLVAPSFDDRRSLSRCGPDVFGDGATRRESGEENVRAERAGVRQLRPFFVAVAQGRWVLRNVGAIHVCSSKSRA